MTNTNSFLAACSNPTGGIFPVMLTANGGDSASSTATELNAQTIFRTAVTLSQGSFYNNGGTGSAQTTPIRVDGVNGNQTLSLASTVGRVTDTTHSDSITAAQKVNWNRPNQFSTTYELTSFSMQCNATAPLAMARNYAPAGTTYVNGTRYLPIGGSDIVGSATEANKQQIIRGASTFKNLSTTVLTSTSGTATVTLRKNTADGNQTISISGTGIQSDTTHTDSIADGDLANYKVVDNSATGTFNQISVEMAGSTSAHGLFGSAATAAQTAATWFIGFGLIGAGFTLGMSTEAPQQHLVKYGTTLSHIRAQFGTGSGGVNGGTLTSRKNTAAGNQSVSVGSSHGTIYEDTTHTDSLVSGDLFNAATTGASSLALDDLAINSDDGSNTGSSTETGTVIMSMSGASYASAGGRKETSTGRMAMAGISYAGAGGRKETSTATMSLQGVSIQGSAGKTAAAGSQAPTAGVTRLGPSRVRNSIASGSFLGRIGKGRGPIQQLTIRHIAAQLKSSGAVPSGPVVTGVALTAPAEFTVSGSPVTSNGTLALAWATEAANKVLAGPTSGSAATPNFRSLVASDIPALPYSPSSLTNGHIFVGNGSNVAADVAMSGDATIANTGAVTLAASGATAATYGDATHVPQIVVDGKGRITLASNVGITQPLAANPTAQVAGAAVNGSAATFMRSDAAPKLADTVVTPGSYGDATHSASFTVDQQGRLTAASSTTITQPVGANPTGTASDTAVNGVATTFMRSDAAPAVQKGSGSAFGLVKVDGTTITAASGVISAVNNGTVTSVALTVPSRQSVGGSPITSSGTLAITDNNQNANLVFSGPSTGAAAAPTFRSLVAADIPDISATYETVSAAAATYLPLAGGTMTGRLKGADGAAATPSVYWGANSGFWNDPTNSGIGISVNGTQLGWFSATGTTYQVAGGGSLQPTWQGEGSTQVILLNYRNTNGGPALLMGKARGTIASPLVPVTNDNIFAITGEVWTGAAFTQNAQFLYKCVETSTVDTTHMGSRAILNLCPIGSGTLTEVARFDNEAGISMFGANPVIDQNRTHILASSTVGTLPTVVAGGLRYDTNLEGGQGVVYGGTANWRNIQNGQVASSILTGSGLFSKFTTYVTSQNRSIVSNTIDKLRAAGVVLGTDLLGLWVFAGAPGSSADALRNWVAPGTQDLTIVGSPTWSQTGGFTGDGSTALLATGATAANFGASTNNVSVGVYVLAGSASTTGIIGNNSAAVRNIYLQSGTSGALVARLADATNDNYTPSKWTGMFTLTRGGSTGYQASVDDGAQTTVTRTSTGLGGGNLCFLGTADATSSQFSTAQVAFSFVGVNLTTAKIAAIRAVMVDYYLVQTGVLSSTYTVANLPGANAAYEGQRLMVSDATVAASGNFGATLTGGGTNHDPVYYETGTPAWRIG